MEVEPNIEWYLSVSRKREVEPRCPFAFGKQVVVLTNFSGTAQEVMMVGFSAKKVHVLSSNFASVISGDKFSGTLLIPAYGAFVGEVE